LAPPVVAPFILVLKVLVLTFILMVYQTQERFFKFTEMEKM
jgi:hypothetical protein